MLPSYQKKVVTGIKKAQGQLNHALNLIDQKVYCLDIAQQINAAIGLLQQANAQILESHLLSCGTHKLGSKNLKDRQAFAKELVRVFAVAKRKG